MCEIGKNIKLCTCLSDSYEKLQHYWILHRFNKNKHEQIVGMPIMPHELELELFSREKMQNQLLERLNSGDAFDFPIEFKSRDQLEIVFNNNSKFGEDPILFCFKFKKNIWQVEVYDSFELMGRYDELKFGKIKGFKIKKYFL